MTAILEKLALYWAYPFVRYALIVGVLIALCSSLLGVTLVLKRFSFIGDGLSHVAFGAMAIAAVLQITNKILLPFLGSSFPLSPQYICLTSRLLGSFPTKWIEFPLRQQNLMVLSPIEDL